MDERGKTALPQPEFSRPISVSDLAEEGEVATLEAGADERSALADRFGLVSLDSLTARLLVKTVAGGPLIRVQGQFEAAVVQSCVVTLAPVRSAISEVIDVEFGGEAAPDIEIDLSDDTAEPPEPLEGDEIDLGELVAQHLSVAIDPYPKAPGAQLDAASFGAADGSQEGVSGAQNGGPFAVLEQLRPKK